MGKSSAARIILESAVRLQLSDAELQQVAPCLQSLLRMHATYDPSGDEEQQFLDSLASAKSRWQNMLDQTHCK